ncbi:MAG: NlpC/P60 family protein [Verrucomicrobiales bacterium]|nr:NlpC/P60 family protein [Verrucomicrobiales bacterium]
MKSEVPAGLFRKGTDQQTNAFSILPKRKPAVPVAILRKRAETIARMKLPYVFGGSSPSDGGMDCSGSIQHLLKSLGYQNVPRTSFQQYEWVKQRSRVKKTKVIDEKDLSPGDLIFWGGTYRSGHKVSHVMLYTGKGTDGKLYMYGARSVRIEGVGGAGVDIHELRPGHHKNLIGFGTVPNTLAH